MKRRTSKCEILASLFIFGLQCVEVKVCTQENSLPDSAVASQEVRRKLITEYENSPKDFHDDRLLAVAISYAIQTEIRKARPIYELYLRNHPNHPRALRGLAGGYIIEKRYDQAIIYLRRAWMLGDVDSLSMLAGSYVKASRYAEMEDLIPSLLQHSEGDAEIVNWLVAYAIFYKDPPDVKLVLKGLSALSDQDILQRDDTAELISEVVARFGRDPVLEMAQLPVLAKIVRGYEVDPKKWPVNRRIFAADSYCLVNQHAKAEPIYREILKAEPHDIPALRGLGISLAYQHKFKEGIVPLRKAWNQGDKLSLSALSACCLGARDFDEMKDLIPALMEQRKDGMDSLNMIIMYSLGKGPKDRELFFKAIECFSDEQLVRNQEVAHNTILGLKLFGEKKRAQELEKLKAKQAKGEKA